MNVNRLKELLNYDESTGIFTHKKRRSGVPVAGAQAGSVNTTRGEHYCQAALDGKYYKVHRLAWLYVYGEMPVNEIDHINGDRLDNRISNLRDVTRATNLQNKTKYKNNNTGVAGVAWNKNECRFKVQINHNQKKIHLGTFKTLEEAKRVREEAEVKYGYHTNHGRDKGVSHDASATTRDKRNSPQ